MSAAIGYTKMNRLAYSVHNCDRARINQIAGIPAPILNLPPKQLKVLRILKAEIA